MKQSTINYGAGLWQRYAVFILPFFIFGSINAQAEQLGSGVSFLQVSVPDPQAPQRYLQYGQISIDPALLSGEGDTDGFINVEEYEDGEAVGWVVRNLPVIDGSIPRGISTMFDLGVSGYPLFSAYVDFSPSPLRNDAPLKEQVPVTYDLGSTESPVAVSSDQAAPGENSSAVSVAEESQSLQPESLGAVAADAIAYTFQLLVDTSVNMPPANKVKFADFSAPAISVTPSEVKGGPPTIRVAYRGADATQAAKATLRGVYVGDPAVAPPVRVVDTTLKFPGGGVFFSFGNAPAVNGKRVAFYASGVMGSGESGFYLSDPNYTKYNTIADQNTAIPDGAGNFSAFFAFPAPALNDLYVAFYGAGKDQRGIYFGLQPGILFRVANTETGCPSGGGTFDTFANPSLSNGRVAFSGRCTGRAGTGIYIGGADGGVPLTVADTTVKCPQNNGMNFSDADNPSISYPPVSALGRGVAFRGLGCKKTGIFSGVPGTLASVADETTAIPGGTGKFTNVGWPSQSGKNVAFKGWGVKQQGIYLSVNGALQVVVDLTMKLNNKTPVDFDFMRSGLDGTYLAFKVKFSDGTTAIYLASPK